MRWASLALVGLVCACAASTPQAGRPSASPVAAVSPSPSPSAPPTVIPFSPPGFKCRLPITLFGGDVRSGAFIDFPSGAVTPAPASDTVNPIIHPGRELIDQSYALYFDFAFSHWLPMHRNAVSPDGTHYAYTDRPVSPSQDTPARASLHVVEVRTGIDRPFDGGDWGDPFVVLDYSSTGIYLTDTHGLGVWLLDPDGGALTRPFFWSNVQGHAGNVFWVGVTNPDDPHPVTATASNQLEAVNAVDGSLVVWFYRPSTSVHFITQDASGHPIIVLSTAELNSEELLYLPSPGVSREILHPGNGLPAISDPLADQHGVWFGSPQGIYLYTMRDGLRQVSRHGGLPANGCL